MKPPVILLTLCAAFLTSQADIVKLSISPPGTDSAAGMSPANESPAVTNSTGSGNAISGGISLTTTSTNATLDFAVGYGSAAGFTDLSGPATAVGVFGPAPTNAVAPLLVDLTPYTFLANDPAKGGVLFGSIILTLNESSNLLAGLDYLSIATAKNTNGEIRGQLINGTPQIACPADATNECTGQPVPLTAHVMDAEGDAMQVQWAVNGYRFKPTPWRKAATPPVSMSCSKPTWTWVQTRLTWLWWILRAIAATAAAPLSSGTRCHPKLPGRPHLRELYGRPITSLSPSRFVSMPLMLVALRRGRYCLFQATNR